MKILIVDDNLQIRNLLRITFSTHPEYKLSQAQNAQEALDIIRGDKPDIIFLDIMMPGDMDGLGLCQFIKTSDEYKSCYVVLLSAKGQKDDVAIGLEMGADKYMTKPFSPISLLDLAEEFKKSH